MDKMNSKSEELLRSQEALESALADPKILAATTEIMRRAAQALPKSIEHMRKSSLDFAEHSKRVEEEIRRGPKASTTTGKRPSGRIV